MDPNYIYYRQQIELMRAAAASSATARGAHERLAAMYTKLIDAGRHDGFMLLQPDMGE